MSLLTETANYDEPGSWGRMSNGWPEIHGDAALTLYLLANKTSCIPYGSYVLIDERGKYGATQSRLRIHPDYIDNARAALAAPSAPEGGEVADPFNYKGMFESAALALADIDKLLGLPEDGCNDPQVTVSALADFVAGHKEMQKSRDEWVDAQYAAAAPSQPDTTGATP